MGTARKRIWAVLSLRGRRPGLLGLRRELAGLPAAADAERGPDALDTRADLAQLSDPRGPLASALRATRWARLFPAA